MSGRPRARTDGRTATWWLLERTEAERSVSGFSTALGTGGERSPHVDELTRARLDAALDHLAEVDDRCDAIIGALRGTAKPWTATVAEAHYLRGLTWEAAAALAGYSGRHAQDVVGAALDEIVA